LRWTTSEAISWLELMLVRSPEPSLDRAQALFWLGFWAANLSRPASAVSALEESIALSRSLGSVSNLAPALITLGQCALKDGRYREAQALLDEGLVLARENNDRRWMMDALGRLALLADLQGDYERALRLSIEAFDISHAMGSLIGENFSLGLAANALRKLGRLAEARASHERVLAQARAIGQNHAIVGELLALSAVARVDRDVERARQLANETLAFARGIGNIERVGDALAELALQALGASDLSTAARYATAALDIDLSQVPRLRVAHYVGQAGAILIGLGNTLVGTRLIAAAITLDELYESALDADEADAHDHALASARATLHDADFNRAWIAGATLDIAQAVAEALTSLRSLPGPSPKAP
jgi:tetratricopeptide (TPR) repeat protein